MVYGLKFIFENWNTEFITYDHLSKIFDKVEGVKPKTKRFYDLALNAKNM